MRNNNSYEQFLLYILVFLITATAGFFLYRETAKALTSFTNTLEERLTIPLEGIDK